MSEKFKDGTVLTAKDLNTMDAAIVANAEAINTGLTDIGTQLEEIINMLRSDDIGFQVKLGTYNLESDINRTDTFTVTDTENSLKQANIILFKRKNGLPLQDAADLDNGGTISSIIYCPGLTSYKSLNDTSVIYPTIYSTLVATSYENTNVVKSAAMQTAIDAKSVYDNNGEILPYAQMSINTDKNTVSFVAPGLMKSGDYLYYTFSWNGNTKLPYEPLTAAT